MCTIYYYIYAIAHAAAIAQRFASPFHCQDNQSRHSKSMSMREVMQEIAGQIYKLEVHHRRLFFILRSDSIKIIAMAVTTTTKDN